MAIKRGKKKSVNGTNYTLWTAATKWWKMLSNVYQHYRCGGITDQNLTQTFTFTQMLKRVLCLNNENRKLQLD